MALKLTTLGQAEVEVEFSGGYYEKVVKVKLPDTIIKHPDVDDEVVPGPKFEVGLSINDIEALVYMLRE